MGMPRDFIIAMASGGMCGMFAMSMVEVMVHRPGLAMGGQGRDRAPDQGGADQSTDQGMAHAVSFLAGFSAKSDEGPARLSIVWLLGDEEPHAAAIVARPSRR